MKDAILQFAIQGKLTEQLPEDGDARDLFKQIQKEKSQLIKAGKLKKENPLPEISEDEIPFLIPENWVWVRLGNVVKNYDSQRKPITKDYRLRNSNLNYPYYGATGQIDTIDNYIFDGKFLLIGEDGGNFYTERPNSFIVEGKFWANNHVHVLQTFIINIEYLLHSLNSFNLPNLGVINGIAVPKLNQRNMNNLLIPIPPLAEQQRIVEKLDQILPLCETLE